MPKARLTDQQVLNAIDQIRFWMRISFKPLKRENFCEQSKFSIALLRAAWFIQRLFYFHRIYDEIETLDLRKQQYINNLARSRKPERKLLAKLATLLVHTAAELVETAGVDNSSFIPGNSKNNKILRDAYSELRKLLK